MRRTFARVGDGDIFVFFFIVVFISSECVDVADEDADEEKDEEMETVESFSTRSKTRWQ